MSDDVLDGGPNHYYYVGRDRFSFADSLSSLPLEDDLDSYETHDEKRIGSLCGFVDSFLEAEAASVGNSIAYSATVNDFCRSMLQSINERVNGVTAVFSSHNVSLEGRAAPFPRGTRVQPETWERLYEAASELLRSYGCIITQHDKKQISARTGVDITPYIWSTLMDRMDLRRIKNPDSSSSVVIYVPRFPSR